MKTKQRTYGMLLGLAFGAAGMLPVAGAAELYGVNAADDGLSIIDPASGAVTFIGALDPDPSLVVTPTSMAIRPSDGKIFVTSTIDATSTAKSLYVVDPGSGLATLIGTTSSSFQALAFAPDGTLYGVDSSLLGIDPASGASTIIGSLGGPRAMGADFGSDGELYALSLDQELVTVDLATGAATLIAVLDQDVGTPGSIVFDASGTLWGSGFGGPLGGILFEIDPATAAVSNITSVSSTTGASAPQGMGFTGAAASAVPCVDFGDLTLGARYTVGATFVTNDASASVWPFYTDTTVGCNPPETSGFGATVEDTGQACGQDNELGINNVNVLFDFGGPVSQLKILYGEFGGNVNFEVNGHCENVPNFADLPFIMGGVQVRVVDYGTPGQSCGEMTLLGTFRSVKIGGQELWIDAICCRPEFAMEFSLDIGSDKEISDPNVDGDEGFDPGDVYLAGSGPVTPPTVPGGRDGFKDDATIFGSDPRPFAPYAGSPAGSAVPVGSGCAPPVCYGSGFDLDAHDQIDFPLQQYVQPDNPLQAPVGMGSIIPSECVYPVEHLALSYDDDAARSWSATVPPRVPVEGPSPAGFTYGTTADRDEVIALNLSPGAFPVPIPFSVSLSYPVASEGMVHPDLYPNPDAAEEDDDDVDSLDVVPAVQGDPMGCYVWLFSPDHEGHLGLDPGGIYEVTAAGPVQVIDEAIHLGLSEQTDIDAFEIAWLPRANGTLVLGIIFSVDDDDPRTSSVDESGGLDPSMIYASAMTGASIPLLDAPLADDVDALTLWCCEFAPRIVHCPGATHGTPFDEHSFGGYIDPKMESSNCMDLNLGLDEVTIHFNCPVERIGGGTLTAADFTASETGGGAGAPSVTGITVLSSTSVQVNLDRPITVKEWMTVKADVQNLAGMEIINLGDEGPGVDEFDRIDVGFLPADVDQDGDVDPFDLLRWRQIALGIYTPECGSVNDYIETDRNGVFNPFDLLAFRQLVIGNCPATRAWNGESMNNPRP